MSDETSKASKDPVFGHLENCSDTELVVKTASGVAGAVAGELIGVGKGLAIGTLIAGPVGGTVGACIGLVTGWAAGAYVGSKGVQSAASLIFDAGKEFTD